MSTQLFSSISPVSAARWAACRLVWAVLGAVAVLALTADAAPIIQRYINIRVTPQNLDLGSVSQPGPYDSPSELKVHITSNCVHGGVVMSMTALTRVGGGSIGPDRVAVKLPGTSKYVPMTGPVVVAGPMNPGVSDFILKFQVTNGLSDAPGIYSGTFQFIMLGGGAGPDVLGPAVQVSLEVEAYGSYGIKGGSFYVHLGRPFDVAEDILTLKPTGTFIGNTGDGMYIGLNLSGVGEPGQDPIERDAQGNLTGRIFGAMAGTTDVLGRSIADEAFDVVVLMGWTGSPTPSPPTYFGPSPDGFTTRTLWWLLPAPGEYQLGWDIRLLPDVAQADGNYFFQAEIVLAPRL